jgi:hypothetical protein
MAQMLAYRPMKGLFAFACTAAALCAVAQPAPAPDARAIAATLAPGAMHEECLRLEAGEKRRYFWKSSAPVDFNIHYHRGNEVAYPVKRERMRGDGGTFTAKDAEDYCWMWTAKDGAKLEGRIEAR